MGLFQSILDRVLAPIEQLFNRIFGGTIVGRLVAKIKDGVRHIITLFDRMQTLVDSIKFEVIAFRNWKEDFHFKSKVINLPKAVERTRALISEIGDAWRAILDIVKRVKDAAIQNPVTEAEELAAELGDLSAVGEKLLSKLPKLTKALEKLLGIVSLIVDALIQWSTIVDELQTIVDTIRDLREEIESGATIFLQQGNARKRLKLANGSSIKIRVGNLHS